MTAYSKAQLCFTFGASILLVAGSVQPGAADSVADFYAGKSISLLIGNGEGGGTDVAARLIARHLGRMIPGNPLVIPRNMPGASGLRATEFLANAAPRDGTVVAFVGPYVIVDKLLKPNLKFEPKTLTWVGRMATQTTFGLIWNTSPIKTIEDARTREVFMTANGANGTAAMVPWALNRIIGTKFKVLVGYPSSNNAAMALERGEADGTGSVTPEFLDTKPQWFTEDKARLIYTIGYARTARAPDAPTIVELAKTEDDRNAMKLLASSSAIGRILFAPPDVPQDRAKALGDAFRKLVTDETFLDEAAKLKIGVEPLFDTDLHKIIDEVFSFPPEVIARMNDLTQQPR